MTAARSRVTLLLVAAAAVSWALAVERMRGMDAGPGTALGGLGWYLGIWVTMTAAMMFPSTVPAASPADGSTVPPAVTTTAPPEEKGSAPSAAPEPATTTAPPPPADGETTTAPPPSKPPVR